MLKIKVISRFKKDLKRLQHNAGQISELNKVIKILIHQKPLPLKYRDHQLSG